MKRLLIYENRIQTSFDRKWTIKIAETNDGSQREIDGQAKTSPGFEGGNCLVGAETAKNMNNQRSPNG